MRCYQLQFSSHNKLTWRNGIILEKMTLLVFWGSLSPLEAATEGVLNSFANLTGKHLCWNLFLKWDSNTKCFSVKFEKFLRTCIFNNICERMLLTLSNIFDRTSYFDSQAIRSKKVVLHTQERYRGLKDWNAMVTEYQIHWNFWPSKKVL